MSRDDITTMRMGMTEHDYKLAYGMTFESDPPPHPFVKVDRSDDLCRRCAKGAWHENHRGQR